MERKTAIENGDKEYFTGRPCKFGHISFRYSSDGACIECRKSYQKFWNANRSQEEKRKYQLEWRKKNPKRWWSYHTFRLAKERAIKKNVPFKLKSAEQIEKLAVDVCPVLGVVLEYDPGTGFTENSPTIDRIIPEKGYVLGNLAVVCRKANTMKSNGTIEDVEKLLAWMKSFKKTENKDGS